MAKVSPVSIKYMIYASFKGEGPVEKPDVIGAIFGQTEGLLGSELEMRELQKEGKIGRIEVDLNIVDGKALGEIRVPSALDKSETTIIAATLETIDRVGPTEAKIEVLRIEDVRGNKRDYIVDRAKKLLEQLESGDDTKIAKSVREETRIAKIQEYGEEKLPAGDLSGPEVIVVEGRADVVNLIKNRVSNVIGMNGTKLPREIARLGEEKELTLFVDGDRGGKLIAKNVIENARVTYVAVAPDGKEVEELEGKEILMSLRKRLPVEEYLGRSRRTDNLGSESAAPSAENVKRTLKDKYASIKDTKRALLLDSALGVIREVSATSLVGSLKRTEKSVFAIVLDGMATEPVIQLCEEMGIVYLGARMFASSSNTKVQLISLY
jgi:DNA primase